MNINKLKSELLNIQKEKLEKATTKDEIELIKKRIAEIENPIIKNNNKYVVKAEVPKVQNYQYKKIKRKEIESIEYNIFGKVKKITYRRGK